MIARQEISSTPINDSMSLLRVMAEHTGACLSTWVPALAARSLICTNLLADFPLLLPVALLLLLLAQLFLFAVSILL